MVTGKLLGEALFVGTYCLILYALLSQIVSVHTYSHLFWFILGFVKHFLGHYIGIHTYYCKYGNACTTLLNNGNGNLKHITNVSLLLPESILEGFGFIAVGYAFVSQFKNKYLAIFIAGFVVHLFAELFWVHKYFCENRCT